MSGLESRHGVTLRVRLRLWVVGVVLPWAVPVALRMMR
jgi:hypothetical protein